MNHDIQHAKELLNFYIREAWNAAGLKWSIRENEGEVDLIVDEIVSGIKDEIVSEIKKEILEGTEVAK